jgi:hypothetical protein
MEIKAALNRDCPWAVPLFAVGTKNLFTPTEGLFMSFDLEGLMKQAKKMQEKMRQVQEELADERIESVTGGGMVKIVVSGQQEIIGVTISNEALEAGAEMLSDMVLVAITDAMKKSRDLAQERFGQLTGGMNFPGLNF